MVQPDSSGIPQPREEMPDWLLPLRSAFLASLLSRGLKTGTVRGYARIVDWLCVEAGRRGLTAPDGIDESVLAQLREPLPAQLSVRSRRNWASVLGRFIAWLVKENAVAAAPQAPVTGMPPGHRCPRLMTNRDSRRRHRRTSSPVPS